MWCGNRVSGQCLHWQDYILFNVGWWWSDNWTHHAACRPTYVVAIVTSYLAYMRGVYLVYKTSYVLLYPTRDYLLWCLLQSYIILLNSLIFQSQLWITICRHRKQDQRSITPPPWADAETSQCVKRDFLIFWHVFLCGYKNCWPLVSHLPGTYVTHNCDWDDEVV